MVLAFLIFFHFDHLVKNLVKILLILFLLEIIDNLFQGVEVIIFEDIYFEIFEFLGAKGAAMMSIDGFLHAVD